MEISITEETYDALAELAIGFDTPEIVIQRLLRSVRKTKPTISFTPSNVLDFKTALLETKSASVCITYLDQSTECSTWKASKLKVTSNILANIWSGFLRNWEAKGIVSIALKVNR